MAVSLFSTLEKEFNSTGYAKRSTEARDWFIQRVKEINGKINRVSLLKDESLKTRSTAIWGSMYMFVYDPKLKQELPYYDRFPLVLVLQPAEGGFLGLNLHYLHPKIRAKFLDKLMSTISDDKLTEKTRLKLRYSLLSSAKRLREFAPCLKHYLVNHMKTRPSQVFATEWETAIFLPTEHFKGATKNKVWMESRKEFLKT